MAKKMNKKVNISVVGRFHAFNLAHYFQERNILNKLITTYPKFISVRWGIHKKNLESELSLEFLRRYSNKIPFFSSQVIDKYVHSRHAKNASKFVKDCDIFIGFSGSSLEALIEAKKLGKISILERGSSHCNFWRKTLSEEFKMRNKHFDMNYTVWQRELLEYELADYISLPSSFAKRTFVENGVPSEKLIVNPYGVDLSEFKQIKKEDSKFRLIFAGGGTFRKGYHYLLKAFHELDLKNCELWHMGKVSSEMQPFLNRYKNKNWILKGHVPQDQLHKFYSQGDVFILPSIEDGYGMVLLQAMACGLPIIATHNTGGVDLVTNDGQEGFIVPIRDVNALKEKILFLYNNKNTSKHMGSLAKKKVEYGFKWEDYGERYFQNIMKILEKHNRYLND